MTTLLVVAGFVLIVILLSAAGMWKAWLDTEGILRDLASREQDPEECSPMPNNRTAASYQEKLNSLLAANRSPRHRPTLELRPMTKRFFLCGYHSCDPLVGLMPLSLQFDTFEEAMTELKRRQPGQSDDANEWLTMWAIDDEGGKWEVVARHETHKFETEQ